MIETTPEALTRALIRCETVTPAEGGALDLLENLLRATGFRVERPTFAEPGTARVENLYARIGDAPPCLMMAGHCDVVPPGPVAAWSHPPFAGAVADGMLYGRGAVDMKGGLACMLSAVLAFLRRRAGVLPGSIAFLIAGDEEGPAVNGTVKLLEWLGARGETFDHALLGEPTNPGRLGEMIKIGRRGSLTGTVTVHGRQGHVAYPHRAENPIPGLLRLAAALTATPLDAGTAYFDASNLELTTIDVGNTATNVIPGSARAVFNVRFNDLWTAQTLGVELARRLTEAAGTAIRFSLALAPSNSPAFLTKPDGFVARVAQAIQAETGLVPVLSTSGGTSDARFIKDACPVVEFGLVGETMHQVDERVALADLDRLTAIYERVLEAYFPAPSA